MMKTHLLRKLNQDKHQKTKMTNKLAFHTNNKQILKNLALARKAAHLHLIIKKIRKVPASIMVLCLLPAQQRNKNRRINNHKSSFKIKRKKSL